MLGVPTPIKRIEGETAYADTLLFAEESFSAPTGPFVPVTHEASDEQNNHDSEPSQCNGNPENNHSSNSNNESNKEAGLSTRATEEDQHSNSEFEKQDSGSMQSESNPQCVPLSSSSDKIHNVRRDSPAACKFELQTDPESELDLIILPCKGQKTVLVKIMMMTCLKFLVSSIIPMLLAHI